MQTERDEFIYDRGNRRLLPAAKMLVELITMAPHKSIEPDKYKEIEEKAPLVTRVYDMVITSRDKVMPVDAIVISGHVVCGYASSPRTDETLLAKHIKDMLKASHYDKMTVRSSTITSPSCQAEG